MIGVRLGSTAEGLEDPGTELEAPVEEGMILEVDETIGVELEVVVEEVNGTIDVVCVDDNGVVAKELEVGVVIEDEVGGTVDVVCVVDNGVMVVELEVVVVEDEVEGMVDVVCVDVNGVVEVVEVVVTQAPPPPTPEQH